MINTNEKEFSPKALQRFIEGCEEISGYWDIDGLHKSIHIFKTDHPDKKGYAVFNGMYFFTDEQNLSIDDLYIAITGKARKERLKEQNESFIESKKREISEKSFYAKKISSFIKQGLLVLAPEHHEIWIDLVPVRAMDMYRCFDLESFLELHINLKTNTFENVKEIFELQGHSGMSASIVFQMLESFSPNGKEFVDFLKGNNKK